MEHFYYKSYVF